MNEVRSNRTVILCTVVGFLASLGLMLYNGTLHTAMDSVFVWSRDLSTAVMTAILIVILCIARWHPQLLHLQALTVTSCVCAAMGYALSYLGMKVPLSVLIATGIVVVEISDSWNTVALILAFSRLKLAQASVLMACTGGLAVIVSYPINTALPYGAVTLIAGACDIALPLLCLKIDAPFFERLSHVGIPAERAVVQPESFLPFSHAFYWCIFVFNVAYGFALRCEDVSMSMTAYISELIAFIGVTLWFWKKRKEPHVDSLYVVAYAGVAIGLMTMTLTAWWADSVASALIMGGYECAQLLIMLALCSAASRNVIDAIPTICWGTAVGNLGVLAGVVLWLLPNEWLPVVMGASTGSTTGTNSIEIAQQLANVTILAGLSLYVVATRQGFSFDKTIAGLAPDPPELKVEIQYIDKVAQGCERVSTHYGLTPREADVLGLLARGYTPSRIRDELGIGYNTVKYHVRNIYIKLDVHGQQELIDKVTKE